MNMALHYVYGRLHVQKYIYQISIYYKLSDSLVVINIECYIEYYRSCYLQHIMVHHPIRALDATVGAGRVFGTAPILILLGFFLTTKTDQSYRLVAHVGTQTRKLPIPVRGSAVPVLVPVLVQAAPYSIIH